ncbi:sensor histidine kinase [Deminuibacter soli]|uniref:histidine kinase n=1 Tax=Deminuibacter soli TaxID=2291815 RepID=A0A3E1NHT6_9BACT|nr:PAS domain-containing sensor histidine kinase [Deminuibacter soli]RFM27467.1 PAS domain S-box protein [Deminuibacter soli]
MNDDFLFRNNPNPMWIYDYQSLRFLAVNNAAIEKYKYTEAQFLQMSLYDIRPTDTYDQLNEKIKEIKYSGTTKPSLWLHRDATGNVFHVKISSTRLDYEGTDARLVVITDVEDLIEQQKQIDALNAQLREHAMYTEETFRSALKHSAIGMALVLPNGRFLLVNDSLCDMLGYTREELSDMSFQQISYPEDLPRDLAMFETLQLGKIDTYQIEKRYIHKNGSLVWAILTVSLSQTIRPHPDCYVSQVIDITRTKEKKQQLQDSLDIISKQNKRLYNFANIVSHNLRAHSNHLNMLLELIGQTNKEEKKEALLLRLKRISAQLTETINNLADIVAIQNQEDKLRYMLPLRAYAQKTIELLQPEIDSDHAQVILRIAPDVEIYYNPAYLESILLNLLSNALKYRRLQVPLVIDVSARRFGGEVLLDVSDNGQGFDMNAVGDRIFGMYQTFHGNADAKGLGLFITKSQVEAMGGSISVTSKPNQGSTFSIRFAAEVPAPVLVN